MNPPHAINAKALVNLLVESARHSEEFYGLVFTKMMVRFATQFEARMIGDNDPPKIETMQGCNEYITRNLERYADGFASIVYGIGKAENILQGGTGSGVRTITRRGVLDMSGAMMVNIGSAKTTDTTVTYQRLLVQAERIGILVGDPDIKGDSNSVTVTYRNCHLADACRAMVKEGIKRVGGGLECATARSGSASTENSTGLLHDFRLVEFSPPKCTFRIFKL